MIHLTDGRPDLYQWDTGRKVTFDGECRQMHFAAKVYGRTVDVDCQQSDGHSTAAIPDRLLQTAGELAVYAYVGAEPESYTKVEKVFHIRRRPKPADYVFTPSDQTTLESIVDKIGDLAQLDTECKEDLVCAINEAMQSGDVSPEAIARAVEAYFQQNPIKYPVTSVNEKTGAVTITAADLGALTQEALQGAISEALREAKESGEFDGKDATVDPTLSIPGQAADAAETGKRLNTLTAQIGSIDKLVGGGIYGNN